MATTPEGGTLPKGRPGPKPRGRTVVPLTITVTHAQRAELEARADTEKSSISTVVRRFIATGLATSGMLILSVRSAMIIAGRQALPTEIPIENDHRKDTAR